MKIKSKFDNPLLRKAAAKAILGAVSAECWYAPARVIALRLQRQGFTLSSQAVHTLLRAMKADGFTYYGKQVWSLQGKGYGMFKP